MIEQIKIEYTNKIKVFESIENINELVVKVLGKALKKERVPYNFFFLVKFVSPTEINEINKEFRNIDEVTDVLSFPVFSKEEIENIIKYNNVDENIETGIPVNLKPYLEESWSFGEIFINLEKIEEQAIEYNHSITRELAYILIHGFYHLLGEDHIDEKEKSQMRKKEETILKELGIFRED